LGCSDCTPHSLLLLLLPPMVLLPVLLLLLVVLLLLPLLLLWQITARPSAAPAAALVRTGSMVHSCPPVQAWLDAAAPYSPGSSHKRRWLLLPLLEHQPRSAAAALHRILAPPRHAARWV